MLLALLVYLPALQNGFVWDDPLILRQMRAMVSWGDLFVTPPEVPRYYFRPLVFATYFLDRELGGESPFWFHASVIAFHAITTVLVFRLAAHWFPGHVPVAVAGAALFAVWPTHAESVAWVAGRSDVIACAFLLTALLLSGRHDKRWTAWAAAMALLCALLAKEVAVAGLLILPAQDWLSQRRLHWARYVPLLLAGVAYVVLRAASGQMVFGGAPTAAGSLDLIGELLGALGYYVERSIAPVGVAPYVPEVPEAVIYRVVGALTPIAIAALIALRWPASRWPMSFLALWFGLTLLPSLGVIVRTSASTPIADRYLYLPSVAGCVGIAWILHAVLRSRSGGWFHAVVVVLVAVLGAQTLAYAQVWRDNVAFWSAAVADVPTSGLAQRELGSALLERGEIDAAERALVHALGRPLDGTNQSMAFSQLGLIYRRQQRWSEAIGAFESALSAAPHPGVYHNLGMTLMSRAEAAQRAGDSAAVGRDVRAARRAFEQALALEDAPGFAIVREQWDPAKTHALLGQVLIALGDRAAARDHLQQALRLQPVGPVADVTRRQLETLGGVPR